VLSGVLHIDDGFGGRQIEHEWVHQRAQQHRSTISGGCSFPKRNAGASCPLWEDSPSSKENAHGARCPGCTYGKIDPSVVIFDRAKLEEGPELYKKFRDKKDGCIKVLKP